MLSLENWHRKNIYELNSSENGSTNARNKMASNNRFLWLIRLFFKIFSPVTSGRCSFAASKGVYL
ncbi:MAG TPA: hypothetical protein VFN35_14370, partial [Ktedonobacteraceae bacterium]|nr:hypothetical protein [Ktedonobacteraceae bacterium]